MNRWASLIVFILPLLFIKPRPGRGHGTTMSWIPHSHYRVKSNDNVTGEPSPFYAGMGMANVFRTFSVTPG